MGQLSAANEVKMQVENDLPSFRTIVREKAVSLFDVVLICKLLRRRRRIVEVPIHYNPRLYGEGKKIRWRHGLKMLWAVVKWRVLPF